MSQSFYDTGTIQTIKLYFQESNWDQIMDTYASNDLDERLIGTAEINGVFFDSVGVKFKGNSTYSANNAKNPLNISLDYSINQDYMSYSTIKLSNGKNDPSFVREVLSYEIIRKYMDAPLSNYAIVYVNDAIYGLYSSSEAINNDFTKKYFEADGMTRVKCNPVSTGGNGCSLEYYGADSSLYYNYYEMKSDFGWDKFVNLIDVINNTPQNIENVLDIDRAIWMLAFDNVTSSLDSYIGPFKQNFYMLEDNNGRFLPILWDLNEGFGGFEMINSPSGPPSPPDLNALKTLDPFLREGDSSFPLLNLVYSDPTYRRMYIAHCKTILEENFSNNLYAGRADTLQSLIASTVQNDPNAFYSYSEFTSNLSSTHTSTGFPPQQTIGLTELMQARVTYLQSHYAFQYTAPVITNIVVPDSVIAFDTVTVTAQVSGSNFVYLGYRHSKDEVFTKLLMFDDGLHGDGSAGDGIFAATFVLDENNTHFYIYAENDEAGIFSPQRAEHEYYKISAGLDYNISGALVINEIMASNQSVQVDQDGEYDDWIELYNNSLYDITLNGYYLTDDDNNLTKWAFPDTSIDAGGYLIVWADNDELQAGLHAGFKLSSVGEMVMLVGPGFQVLDTVVFDAQFSDMGFARNPNGYGPFVIQIPTFSANNESSEGIEDITTDDRLFVYPNPATDILFVESDEDSEFSIFDLSGKMVASGQVSGNNEAIEIANLQNGMYIIRMNDKSGRFIKSGGIGY